jgi:hypothetical protein
MTRFDFDVIGDTPERPLPNVQKPPAEKAAGENPAQSLAEKPAVPEKERHRAA